MASIQAFPSSLSLSTHSLLTASMKIIENKDYMVRPWKNGLGETREIAIHPPDLDFQTDQPFLWRFSSSEIRDSCTHSIFPGYDVSFTLLPESPDSSSSNYIHLFHNDNAVPVKINSLTPYTYSGDWPTKSKLDFASSQRHLLFMVNRKYAQFSTSIETIYPLNDDDEETDEYANFDPQDSDDDFELDNTSTKKFSTGRFMILYVISGDIKVAVDGEKTVILNQGSTMIYEKCDDFHPSDVSMIPIAQSNSDEGLGASKSNISNCVPCATVMTIQLQVFKYEKLDFATSESPLISPALSKTNTQRDHRGRAGSIIVYDDQPGSMIEIGKSMIDIGSSIGNLTTKTWQSAHKYIPPKFSARYRNESDVPPAVIKDSLEISDYPNGTISTAWINMVKEGLSEWIRIPVIIAKGTEPGPVVGITAVVHGNELNGVPCIHRVITDIDVNSLKGTVVAVPCVNVPGYLRFSREFSDGKDLNRQFPGSQTGTASQVYNYCFFEKIIRKLNYLIDLHTASFGRVNSYYVRSDLNDPVSAAMAKLQQPQIILHNSGQDGTLRSAASACGIKAITVEIGNPQLLQNQFVQWSYMGVMRILAYLNMFSYDISDTNTGPSTLVCSRGFWIYTTVGGVLEVYPAVNTLVRKGDLIARIKNIFGNIVNEVFSPSNGVVFLYYAGNRKKFKSCGNDWRSSLAFGCS